MTEKQYTLNEINQIIGGILTEKESGITVNRVAPPLLSDEKTLALALNEEEIENMKNSRALVAIVPLGVSFDKISTIEVERPRLAMMKILHLFYIPPDTPAGIHETAVVHPSAKIGEHVSIGPHAVIGRDAVIGNNTKIMAGVYVGKNVVMGDNCLFHPNCCIGDFVEIGSNVIIHHGASIGADGYSFVTETPSNVETAKESGQTGSSKKEQRIYKIPSLGSVVIGDDVEIGANATIDRGTIENTVIGKGTKIDNLVMIAHNCKIGQNCMIVSQVGVAGSSEVGDRTVLAGQVGLADHVKVGADSIVMAQAGVSKSFPDRSIIMGSPAVPRKEFIKQLKMLKDAEKLFEEFKGLKEKFEHLLEEEEA